jgi:hypothetical protein
MDVLSFSLGCLVGSIVGAILISFFKGGKAYTGPTSVDSEYLHRMLEKNSDYFINPVVNELKRDPRKH